MYLKKGQRAAYKKRHNEIWPELKRLLKEAGDWRKFIRNENENNDLLRVVDLHAIVQKFSRTKGNSDRNQESVDFSELKSAWKK